MDTLTISVFADKSGDIGSLGVGESGVANLTALESRLQQIFADKDNSFEQVIIQVGSNLRYEALMKVVDICTRLEVAQRSKTVETQLRGSAAGVKD